MDIDKISPYQLQKNLEGLQERYESLLSRVEVLQELVDTLENRLQGDVKDESNLE